MVRDNKEKEVLIASGPSNNADVNPRVKSGNARTMSALPLLEVVYVRFG
jgi:hypothetical protein